MPVSFPLTNINGILGVDSRDVAEVVGKKHTDLLRNIHTYIEYLTESKIALSEFFIETTYTDSTGRTLPCYLITEKGCEMIAHKMTGKKGVVFTAMYVNAFHDMKEELYNYKLAYQTTKPIRKTLAETIKNCIPDSPHKKFAYSTYNNLAYVLLFGCSAKKLKTARGAETNSKALAYLTADEVEQLAEIENKICILIEIGMEYKEIKDRLTAKA